MPESPEKETFEAQLATIEDLVRKLQDGAIPLDEALTLYEQGHQLVAQAQTRLAAARMKLETLQKEAPSDEETTD